ncbi:hypothetical protein Ctob_005350 [Chrysochromulina tobinii]|uniref:Uncharacterized protein n=1 Tax=Chrysochromulina tobinii TaxID=1460289 RepID=A0A0M0JYV2_9EUKA|nr:hypothetical protein Ctob_005350 [Chrysochromulina tobinii]|eukprot:KOO31313.1 hypothetical protein Ctob_005350 [Chrysochromulina sp. CCMP291]
MEMQRLFSESAAALEMERRARELADGMRASKDSFVAVSVQAAASAVDQAKAARTAGLRKARALVLASRESAAHAAEVARTKDERSSELATASLKAAIEARESGDEAAQLQMLAEAEAAREHNLVEGAARSQAILTQRESTHKIAAARIDEAELAVRSAGSVARGIETEAKAERRRGFEASERGRAVAAQAAAEDAVRVHEKMSVEEKAKQRLVSARHAASQAQLDVAIATEREAKRKATIEGLRMAIEARRISFSALKLATRAREACELQAEALERTAITCEGRVAQLDERKRMALSSPSSPRPPATASKARPEVGEPSVKAVASTVGPVVGPESRGTASSPKLTATDPLMADAAATRPAAEPPPAKLPVAGLAAPKPKPAATRFETAQARAAVASVSNTEVKLGVARRAAARAREVAAKAQGAVEEAKARELAKEKEAQEATDKVLLMQKEAADLRRRSGSSASTAERGPGLGGVITRASADANSTAASVAALASDKTPSPWLFAPEQKRQAPLKVISSRAAADEKKFHAERAAEAAKRAAAERVAVERAVERRSREAQAALLRTGAAHAARAALLEAKVSAARESAARAHTEALAKIEAAKHLDEASAAQRKLVAAEWRAAEEAAAAHALAVEKAASAARGAAARRAVAERAEELARAAHLEALAASEHAIALAEAVVAAEADEARLQGEDAEASHQGAMQ